jgi:ATP-dependent protease ClpP protease subunit
MMMRMKKNRNDFSDMDLLPPVIDPLRKKIISKVTSQLFDFYLNDEIEDICDYIDLMQVLDSAGPNDTIVIHINSVGGRLDIALQLRNAIVTSEANVIASLEGHCYSAATIIALSCKTINVTPYCQFMVHTYSHVLYGKENETKSQKEFVDRFWDTVIDEVYSGFLTDEEIVSVRSGTDIWLTSKEMVPRLNALKEKNEQKESEMIQNNASLIDDESLDEMLEALSSQLDLLKKEKKKRTPAQNKPATTKKKAKVTEQNAGAISS